CVCEYSCNNDCCLSSSISCISISNSFFRSINCSFSRSFSFILSSQYISNWNIEFYSGFTDVTTNFGEIDKNKFLLPNNFPDDEVLQIFVSGTYNGFDYGQTLTWTLKKEN
ncbi:MAG: hypothetical protein J6C25_00180, partial [Treponema sp.]|nr:hypothetical protein [Treponema sp.]